MLTDLELLRCFDAVATNLNFARAARVVSRSPAAVSEQIRRLEEQLGAPLFLRTTRKVSLTDAGQRLLPEARQAIAQMRRCEQVVRGPAAAPTLLRVGTRYELGLSWLLPALEPLERARPGRKLELVFGDSPELLHRTRHGELDACVTSARLAESALAYALLHEEAYVFVASAALLARAKLSSPRDAVRHTLIDAAPDLPLFRYFLDASPREERWSFQAIERMGTIAAIRHRVRRGHGVAVLPRYLVQTDLDGGALVELLPRRACKTDFFRLVWRRDHPLEGELQALAGELRERPLE